MTSDTDEILATISASQPRRWLAVLALMFLGGLLIYVAFATPPSPGWLAFLLVFGGLALFTAEKLRRGTEAVLELTRDELRERGGEVIARVEDIKAVERGFLAFKPSNGFLIRTHGKGQGRRWRPGMWWRIGRSIGVGGVTPGHQTKFASEVLLTLLATRDQDDA